LQNDPTSPPPEGRSSAAAKPERLADHAPIEANRLCQLPSDVARRVDEICDVFETQLAAGGHPRIEEFLGAFQEPGRSVLLGELLWLELEWYLSAGEFPDLETYCQRFPDRAAFVRSIFEEVLSSRQPSAGAAWPEIPNYHVLERLGEGGMGTVYKAVHTRLQSLAAVKVLRADRMEDVEATIRFQREMKVIGNLSHPHIVQARDAGESRGTHYLIMEYVEGLDLGNVMCRLGPLPLADVCEMARQVALALQYVHEHNLVHRDIKPSNLLLGHPPQNVENVHVKVADLGLARLLGKFVVNEHVAQYGRIMGTYRYMAPEQYWTPEAVDIRSDVYSLGCTLYALLVGRPPFGHPEYRDPGEIMLAHRDCPVPSFRSLRPDVPPQVEEIILSMIAKQPSHRPQSPGQLAESLACFGVGADLPGLLARAQSQLPGPIMSVSATADNASFELGARGQDAGLCTTVDAGDNGGAARAETVDVVPRGSGDGVSSTGESGSRVVVGGDSRLSLRESSATFAGQKTTMPARERLLSHAPRLPFALRWVAAGAAVVVLVALLGTWLGGLATTRPVDLLAMVNLDGGGIGGRWTWDDRTLVSPDVPRAIVMLPRPPSPQYKMEISAERISGGRWVIGLVWRGRQIPLVMDEVAVRPVSSPTAQAKQPSWAELPKELRLANGKQGVYTCIVGDCGFVVAYGDQLRVSHVAGRGQPTVDTDWLPPEGNVLFLGCSNSVYRFKEVVVTPSS